MPELAQLKIVIRGAGDLATGVALRLHRAGFNNLLLLEAEYPLAVRRMVAFSEAVYHGEITIEGVTAQRLESVRELATWPCTPVIPVLVDPGGTSLKAFSPDIVIDAIIAKQNIGTTIDQAALVIGLGPGFTPGKDVHCVIETNRGHSLGRVLYDAPAAANTGIPGNIGGYTKERVLKSPQAGIFTTRLNIGDRVAKGAQVGAVDETPIQAEISGILRGLLRTKTPVKPRTKLGDIDPRDQVAFCDKVSDKAMAVGGGVLEAILHHFIAEHQ